MAYKFNQNQCDDSFEKKDVPGSSFFVAVVVVVVVVVVVLVTTKKQQQQCDQQWMKLLFICQIGADRQFGRLGEGERRAADTNSY